MIEASTGPETDVEAPPSSLTGLCDNCGGPASQRGRRSRSGKRYCSKPKCQRARRQARADLIQTYKPDREVPTSCSCCGAKLPKRQWRVGDQFGRWCTKPTCRRHQVEALDEAGRLVEAALQIQKLELALQFVTEAVMCDNEDYLGMNRVTCRVCGLTSAIRGWVHPTEDFTPCEGTLDGQPPRAYGRLGVGGGWPFRRHYLSPEELEEQG